MDILRIKSAKTENTQPLVE